MHGSDPSLRHWKADNSGKTYGHGGSLPAFPSWLSVWVVRDGCGDPLHSMTGFSEGNKVHHVPYSVGGSTQIVRIYKGDPMKHTWPTVVNGDLIDVTPLVMAFIAPTTNNNRGFGSNRHSSCTSIPGYPRYGWPKWKKRHGRLPDAL